MHFCALERLEQFLQELFQSLDGTKVHVMLISRAECDIRRQITVSDSASFAVVRTYEIRPGDTWNDIEAFARRAVNKRLKPSHLGNEAKEKLVTYLSARCEGMFLWVRLSARNLHPGRTLAQLIRDISEPTTDLN